MEYPKELIELLNVVTNSIGRISPKIFTESYLTKIGKQYLWVWFQSNTSHLQHIPQLSKKLIFLKEGHLTECPRCIVCGNPVTYSDGKISEVCSQACSKKDPNRAAKISNSKLNMDPTESNKKRKVTMLKKYGCETNSQRVEIKEIIREKASKRQLNNVAYQKLNDIEWLEQEYQIKKRSALEIAIELKCDYSSILSRVRANGWEVRQVYNTSIAQKQLEEYIQSLGFKTSSPTNLLIGKQEIDVYVEERQFGIELDGLLYHSYNNFETKAQRYYHYNKTIAAKQSNIDLIHITDQQWNEQQDIVKSIIKSKLGLLNKLYARKCTIKEVSVDDARLFFDKNHIQGYVGSKYRYGLYYNSELVACISFGIPRYDKSYDWELLRFCNKLDYQTLGGFSKLLKYFQRNNKGTIITYADCLRGYGDVYEKNGFTLQRFVTPGYFWTDGNKVFSRTQFMKNKLKNKLTNYDENKSEAENMFANNFRRFWDCGKLVFSI